MASSYRDFSYGSRNIARVVLAVAIVAMAIVRVTDSFASDKDFALRNPTSVASMPFAPSNVPRDYVVTPNGYFHPSCVHRIGNDETLHADGTIVSGRGVVRSVPACAYPRFDADGTPADERFAPAFGAASTVPGVLNGWVADAEYVLPRANSARFMSADMTVPDAPNVDGGQTVYFFPGFQDHEPVNALTIVQPVLGWNAFDDSAWSIASWNCCNQGSTWHSDPVAVDAGITVEGRMIGSNCVGPICDQWSILTRDPANDNDTVLNTSGFGQAFDWVFGAVLEAYSVQTCDELPSSGPVEFSNILVGVIGRPSNGRIGAAPHAWALVIAPSVPSCDYSLAPHPSADSPDITLGY